MLPVLPLHEVSSGGCLGQVRLLCAGRLNRPAAPPVCRWNCCRRAVSVVAPVYYAHLLAYRVRVLDDGDGSASWASGSSGGGRQEPCYCDSLADKMFFV